MLLFLDSEYLSKEECGLIGCCNRAAEMLFPYNGRQAEAWSVWAFKQYRMTGKSPERLRDERCPGIKELYAKRPPKRPRF